MAERRPAPVPVGIDAFLIAIASLAIILRLVSRKLSHAGFWWDDWLAVIALVSHSISSTSGHSRDQASHLQLDSLSQSLSQFPS